MSKDRVLESRMEAKQEREEFLRQLVESDVWTLVRRGLHLHAEDVKDRLATGFSVDMNEVERMRGKYSILRELLTDPVGFLTQD